MQQGDTAERARANAISIAIEHLQSGIDASSWPARVF
jgi:hypothetical protein